MVVHYSNFLGQIFQAPSVFRSFSVDEVPEQIGASIGLNIYGYSFYNPNGSEVFLKFYSKATSPTVGTDIPTATFQVPASGSVVLFSDTVLFALASKGWIVAVTGSADSNTTAPGSDILAQILYR
jgi:hypothetical protein